MTRCDFCPTGKSAKPCPPPVAKIYRFTFDPKHLYKPRRLVPSQRGVSWSSRNVGAGCDGRRRYRRRTIPMRTAKPCGPGARCWRQVCGECPQATVANKPDHRGERGISRKPLRRGCPGASAEPVCSCAPLLPLRMRPRVQRAPGIPCALWFIEGHAYGKNSGAFVSRECKLCPSFRGVKRSGASPESIQPRSLRPNGFRVRAARAPELRRRSRAAHPGMTSRLLVQRPRPRLQCGRNSDRFCGSKRSA